MPLISSSKPRERERKEKNTKNSKTPIRGDPVVHHDLYVKVGAQQQCVSELMMYETRKRGHSRDLRIEK